MGLISAEVEVNLNCNTFQHYERLGYEIPRYADKYGNLKFKRGTKIIVNVADLPKGATVYVDVQCDYCKTVKKLMYSDYQKTNHDGLCYCKNCASKVLKSGKNSHFWNSNLTEEERSDSRNYPEYYNFIKKVLARDNYTCQCCYKTLSGDAQVHHLNGYNWYKEGRTDETNAVTLCENCHRNFHIKYGRGNNTREQYEEWIGCAFVELERYNGVLNTARKIYCFEDDKVYDGASQLSETLGCKYESYIYNICNNVKKHNSIKGKHLIWYDVYLQNTDEENEAYLKSKKNHNEIEVICLNSLEIFESGASAAKIIGDNKRCSNITRACKSKGSTYKHPITNEKLYWRYYDEYQSYDEKIKQELKNQYYTGSFLLK